MLIVFLFLWCVSPLVLIPLVIVFCSKNSKQKKKNLNYQFSFDTLLASGDITREQYEKAMRIVSPENYHSTNTNYQQPNPMPPQSAHAPVSQNNNYINNPTPVYYQAPAQYTPPTNILPPEAAEKTKRVSTINIILIVGILFIIVAGIIFASTTWHFLPNILRTVTILSVTALFFGVSVLADKKLHLTKTGTAFYILGSIFLPITIISAGFFNLMGSWLCMGGDGKYILLLSSSIALGFSAYIGAMKYKFKFFAWTTLFTITSSVVCLILEFNPKRDVFGLCVAIYSTAFIFLAEWFKKKEIDKFSMFTISLDHFTIINTLVLSITTIFITQNSAISSVSTLLFAFTFLKSIFNTNKASLGAYPFSIFMLLALYKLISPNSSSDYLIVITAFVITSTLIGSMKLFENNLKKVIRIISVALSFVAIFIAGIWFVFDKNWNITSLVTTFVLLVNTTLLGAKYKNKLIIYLQTIILVIFFNGVACIFTDVNYAIALIVATLTLAAFFVYRITDVFHSRFSDVTFGVVSFICGFVALDYCTEVVQSLAAMICMLVFVAITAVIAFEKPDTPTSKVFSWILPFSLFGIALAADSLVEQLNPADDPLQIILFIYFIIILAIALYFSFAYNKNYITSRFKFSFEVCAIVSGSIFFLSSVSYDKIFPYLLGISILCAVNSYFSHKNSKPVLSKIYFYFAFALANLSCFVTTSNYTDNNLLLFLVPAIFSALCLTAYIILKKFTKANFFALNELLVFSAYSTSITAALLTLYISDNRTSPWFAVICLAVCAVSYAAFYMSKFNVFGFIPMLLLFSLITTFSEEISMISSHTTPLFSNQYVTNTTLSILMFVAISCVAIFIHNSSNSDNLSCSYIKGNASDF